MGVDRGREEEVLEMKVVVVGTNKGVNYHRALSASGGTWAPLRGKWGAIAGCGTGWRSAQT